MRNTRKGFTLVELLIVITIMSILSAAMVVSGSSANAAAKASTIYNNINAIRTSAMVYQLQKGIGFKESGITAALLKTEVELDLDEYNKTKEGTTETDNNITYAIVAGTSTGAGAYVICKFADDGDATGIAKALKGYKNVRINETDKTIGAFLFHNTPATYDSTATNNLAYDCAFAYPTGDSSSSGGGSTEPTTEPGDGD